MIKVPQDSLRRLSDGPADSVKIVFRLVLIVAGFAGAPCGNELIAAGTLISLAGRYGQLSGGRAEVVQFALEIIHV